MQNTWLTQTKFVPPRLQDDVILRSRLVDTLRAAVKTHPLTLLSAPAGYGKTTLLTSLTDIPLAWVSIDEEDNDPARFFITLLNVLQKLDSNFGEGIQSLLSSLENPASESHRIISAFINEVLEKLPETLLVFDDLHFISEPVIYLALDYLLEHLPPQMHMIISTRQDPPLSLARLRARGQLAEFRAPDLRFTTDEASLFLNEKQHLGLSFDDLTKLQSRAEGWAVGLRLLAGSLDNITSASDRTAFIQDLALSDRYVFDFLTDEVLKRQEPEVRAFLLETSILAEITPSLCAAVTGRSDAQSVLEELYRRNLFLIQAGGTERAYRYHSLFAEFLREQLGREMPERNAELHRCAAEAQKTTAPTRAIAHYLSAELWDDAAQTIEQVSEEFVRQGLLKTLNGWINALPVQVRDTHPRLLYVSGMLTLLETARRMFKRGDDQANLAEVLPLMIDTVSRQHDYVRQADLIQEALAIPLPAHGRAQVLMAQAWQSLYQSDYKKADEALDHALKLTLASNDMRAFNVMAAVVNLHLAFLPSGTTRLEHYCREVLARFRQGVTVIRAGTLSMQSCLFFLNGAVEQAAGVAEEARSMCNQLGGMAYSDFQARFVQAQVVEVRGDHPRVEELWREALPMTEQIPSLNPFLVTALYFIGRAQWMQGKFDQAQQTEARISEIVDPTEFPENALLRKLMRAFIELNDRKFDDAERTLQQGIPIEQKWLHAVAFGSARLMLAHLRLQQKREQDAWLQFRPFLAECEQCHLAGLILRENTLAIPLLHLAIEKKSNVDFAQHLLDQLSASDSPKPVPVPETGQTLTTREVEVLKLIAEGATNRIIAQRLVISEHTVKAHITSIYSKLQVTSRTKAAARARELRLV